MGFSFESYTLDSSSAPNHTQSFPSQCLFLWKSCECCRLIQVTVDYNLTNDSFVV